MSVRKSFVVASVICLALAGAVDAQARAGFGGSFGSRGSNSFNSVPSTRTAPSVSPLGAQPGVGNSGLMRPGVGSRGMFGGFGRGLLGGFLGAGLIGLLFGHGLFGGLGGLMSMFGLLIQVGLLFLLVRFAIGFFRRQSFAGAGPATAPQTAFRTGGSGPFGGFGGSPARGPAPAPMTPLPVGEADFARFEAALVGIQTAFSAEDGGTLRRFAIPKMADEFASELQENRSRGIVNRMSDIRFLQGDLAESWRETGADYASVAMRYSLIDAMISRADGRVVGGDAHRPQEVTEVWTFVRPAGGRSDEWQLSAIQQTR